MALFALTAYAIGCCAMVAAMLLDGFVVPQLAGALITPPAADADTASALMRAIGIVIQVLTKAEFLSMCAALLVWSHVLWTGAGISRWSRWCACIGIAAGLIAIFSIHAVWNLAAALVLYTPPPEPARFAERQAVGVVP